MIGADLRSALRRLQKDGIYAWVNVVGLALGLTTCAFIAVYVADELSWERGHENRHRIVRLGEDQIRDGETVRLAETYGPLGPAVEGDLPFVEAAVRLFPYDLLVDHPDGTLVQERAVLFADSTFFDTFTFQGIHGGLEGALDAPFSVVLTEGTAQRYFGPGDPTGKTLQIRDDGALYLLTVTAVMAEPPPNTHLQFDMVVSWSSMRTIYGHWIEDPRNWDHPPVQTYALLAEGVELETLQAALPGLAATHMGESRTQTRSLVAEPLMDLRLRSGREGGLQPPGAMAQVMLFVAIGLLILLVACINFSNLATAGALRRTAEVGTRKALGAGRGQLVRQFLLESLVLAVLAVGLVVAVLGPLAPVYEQLAGKAFRPVGFLGNWTVPVLLGAVLLVGLMAGGYPAIVLSKLTHARARESRNGRQGLVRRALVVLQFVVSIGLIVGTAVVQRQLDFVQNERLGFQKDRVVIVPLRDTEQQINNAQLLQSWRGLPGVEFATASSGMPGLGDGIHDFMVRPQDAPVDSLSLMVLTVDEDYAETYGLHVVAGRDLSWEHAGDATGAFLLNETAAGRLGWTPEAAVGKRLNLGVWYQGYLDKAGTVVGVVADFQYNSLRAGIDPILFHVLPTSYYYDWASARLGPGDVREHLSALEMAWARFSPDRPFEYRFLDDQFDAMYRSEQRLAGLLTVFAFMAIVIACLGLFGLSSLATEQRTKEVGIRKVLGASGVGLAALLSRDLLTLVGIAFLVAAPMAWWAADLWMQGFVLAAGWTWQPFLGAAAVCLVASTLAVGWQAFRAAQRDPIESLRYE